MEFTDSHHHLQDYKTKNAQQILETLRKNNFIKVVNVSSKPDEWNTIAEIATQNPKTVIPAFGLHPWFIKEASANWIQKLKEMLIKFPYAQIGECGLDRLKAPAWEGQLDVFEQQIELARSFQRPLNIHLLKAENDFHSFWHKMPQKFMFHSFSASTAFLKKALDNGAYISVSATVLKRKNAAEIICFTPLNRLLTETDAPYQANCSDMKILIEEISKQRKLSPEEIAKNIFQNFENFNKYEIS